MMNCSRRALGGAAFEAVISPRQTARCFARILCASAGLSFLICAPVSPASTSCLRMVFVIIMGTLAEAAAGDAVEEEVGGAVMPFALLLSLQPSAWPCWSAPRVRSGATSPPGSTQPLLPPLAPFLGEEGAARRRRPLRSHAPRGPSPPPDRGPHHTPHHHLSRDVVSSRLSDSVVRLSVPLLSIQISASCPSNHLHLRYRYIRYKRAKKYIPACPPN